MIVVLISLFLITVFDWILLFFRIRPRSIFLGHGIFAFLVIIGCSLESDFDLGPHIEVPGWMAGLIVAGVSIFTALVAVGIWVLIAGLMKKRAK
jgi:hypothetical protein